MTPADSVSLVRTLLQDGNRPIIIDGALATELEHRGCNLKDRLWSAKILLERPEIIRQVHLDYFKAGADIAITASYQASLPGFQERGLDATAAIELIELSVTLAKQARDDAWKLEPQRPMLIAGSVGPYGAYLADGSEYKGNYRVPQNELKAFHRPRLLALVDSGVDMIAFETLPSFEEIKVLHELLIEMPGVCAWFSFAIRTATELCDGTPLFEVIRLLDDCAQVEAIGVNCVSRDSVTPVLKHMSLLTSKPLLAYPNSGELWDASSNTWHGSVSSDSDMTQMVTEWRKCGAKLIGGCCRTTPADIHIIRQTCQTDTIHRKPEPHTQSG